MATVLQSPLLIVNSTVEFLISSMGSGDVAHNKVSLTLVSRIFQSIYSCYDIKLLLCDFMYNIITMRWVWFGYTHQLLIFLVYHPNECG